MGCLQGAAHRLFFNSPLMPVAVVDVRVMRMAVIQGFVLVKMAVGFNAVPGEIVAVLVVRIVHVPVLVGEGGMGMGVLMAFRQV